MNSRKAVCRSGFASRGSSLFLISVRMSGEGRGGEGRGGEEIFGFEPKFE